MKLYKYDRISTSTIFIAVTSIHKLQSLIPNEQRNINEHKAATSKQSTEPKIEITSNVFTLLVKLRLNL